MRWFASPEPDEPDLLGVLELDRLPIELHLLAEGIGVWMTDTGDVISAFELPQA